MILLLITSILILLFSIVMVIEESYIMTQARKKECLMDKKKNAENRLHS